MPRRGHDVVVKNCATCQGGGHYGTGVCPACDGRGRHKFRLRRDEMVERCNYCGGSGSTGMGLCPQCGGSGWQKF